MPTAWSGNRLPALTWIREPFGPTGDSCARLREVRIKEREMQGDREERIRRRAYALWEQQGRPDGKDVEHWLRAEAEISGGSQAGVTDDGKVVPHPPRNAVPKPRRRSAAR